jgi:beta-alanine degradation protein BauB
VETQRRRRLRRDRSHVLNPAPGVPPTCTIRPVDAHRKAVQTVQVDNERVRVSEWRFASGAATGFHRHEFDYVVVPMTTGSLLLVEDGQQRETKLTAGLAYYRSAGVEHDVINASGNDFTFVEVELKPPAVA